MRASGDRLEVVDPPRGAEVGGAMGIAMGVLVCAVVAPSTGQALHGDTAGLAVALPLWLLGLVIIGRSAASMLQGARLDVRPDESTLRFTPFGRTRRLQTAALRVRAECIVEEDLFDRPGEETWMLALEHRGEVFWLLRGRSDVERRWVQRLLERRLPSAGEDSCPVRTTLILRRDDDQFVLIAKPRGRRSVVGMAAAYLAAVVGILCRSTEVTLRTAVGSGLTALALGGMLFGGKLAARLAGARLVLGLREGTLVLLPFGWRRRLETRRVRVRRESIVRGASDTSEGREVPVLLIAHGTDEHELLEGWSAVELDWVRDQLQAWLRTVPR